MLAGEEDWATIDDWVARWHESDDGRPLHEFLGMTEEEAGVWAADARNISAILYSRRRGLPLDRGIGRIHETGLAARTSAKFDAAEVRRFLRDEGITS